MSQANPIVEYGVTDAALNELSARFNAVPDAETKEGYKLIKAALKELIPLRTGIEKKRKELNAEAVAWKKKVDTEAKRITSSLLEIETPFQEAKKTVDNASKIAEQKRIDDIQHRIECIKNVPLAMLQASSEELQSCIDDLKADPVKGFAEFEIEALKARNDAVAHLEGILSMRTAQEQQALQPSPAVEPGSSKVDDTLPFADDDFASFVDDEEPLPFGDGILDHALSIEDDGPYNGVYEDNLPSSIGEAESALARLHGIDAETACAIMASIKAGLIPGVFASF